MAKTGMAAANALDMMLQLGGRLPIAKEIRRLNFLIPLTSQCTLTNPCKDIYQKLEQLEDQYNVSLSFNPAFPLADSTYTGPTVIGYDLNTNYQENNSTYYSDNLKNAITSLFEYINSKKHEFELKLFSEQEAINYYLQKLPTQNKIAQEKNNKHTINKKHPNARYKPDNINKKHPPHSCRCED